MIGWVRLHKPPKVRGDDAKKKYYFDRSYARYCNTEDGKYINSIAPQFEFGRVDSVRFIETVTHD